MKKILFLTIISTIFLLTACEPPKGEPIEYAKMCDVLNDGKTVEVEGFLDSGTGVYCSNTSGRMECGFKLKSDLKDETGNSVDIAIRSGANSMDKLERGYTLETINIRGNDGNKIDLTKKVKVTGDMTIAVDSTTTNVVCFMKVLKIEQ